MTQKPESRIEDWSAFLASQSIDEAVLCLAAFFHHQEFPKRSVYSIVKPENTEGV